MHVSCLDVPRAQGHIQDIKAKYGENSNAWRVRVLGQFPTGRQLGGALELAVIQRIIALPGGNEGKTVRGYAAVRLALVDEAARCEDGLFAVVRPMLGTSDGSLIMLSTPFGKRGEFHRAWTEGEGWTGVRIPASACPRLSKEFLAEELRELGAMRFSEEYELAFNEPDESMFPTAIIDRAFTADVRPLWS